MKKLLRSLAAFAACAAAVAFTACSDDDTDNPKPPVLPADNFVTLDGKTSSELKSKLVVKDGSIYNFYMSTDAGLTTVEDFLLLKEGSAEYEHDIAVVSVDESLLNTTVDFKGGEAYYGLKTNLTASQLWVTNASSADVEAGSTMKLAVDGSNNATAEFDLKLADGSLFKGKASAVYVPAGDSGELEPDTYVWDGGAPVQIGSVIAELAGDNIWILFCEEEGVTTMEEMTATDDDYNNLHSYTTIMFPIGLVDGEFDLSDIADDDYVSFDSYLPCLKTGDMYSFAIDAWTEPSNISEGVLSVIPGVEENSVEVRVEFTVRESGKKFECYVTASYAGGETPEVNNVYTLDGQEYEINSAIFTYMESPLGGLFYAVFLSPDAGLKTMDAFYASDNMFYFYLDENMFGGGMLEVETDINDITTADGNYGFQAMLGYGEDLDLYDQVDWHEGIASGSLYFTCVESFDGISAVFEAKYTMEDGKTFTVSATAPYVEPGGGVLTENMINIDYADTGDFESLAIETAFMNATADGVEFLLSSGDRDTWTGALEGSNRVLKLFVPKEMLDSEFNLETATGDFSLTFFDAYANGYAGLTKTVDKNNREGVKGSVSVWADPVTDYVVSVNLSFDDVTVTSAYTGDFTPASNVSVAGSPSYVLKSCVVDMRDAKKYTIYLSPEAGITTVDGMVDAVYKIEYPADGPKIGSVFSFSHSDDLRICYNDTWYDYNNCASNNCDGGNMQLYAFDAASGHIEVASSLFRTPVDTRYTAAYYNGACTYVK